MSGVDFEALRAERNASWQRFVEKCQSEGYEFVHSNFDPNACYCACAEGGPCEHDWDGVPYESPDGGLWTTTCSKCGTTNFHHSLMVLP